jgi:hypothetical protein
MNGIIFNSHVSILAIESSIFFCWLALPFENARIFIKKKEMLSYLSNVIM